MLCGDVFDRFLRAAPVCVMARVTLKKMFAADVIDELFRVHADQQYEKELLFSAVVDVMTLVATRVSSSVNAANQLRREEIGVSLRSLYNKLQGVESQVARALVRHSADAAGEVLARWSHRQPG